MNGDPESLLERAWSQREEHIYPALFGPTGPGIYPLYPELFTQRLEQDTIDPRWLHYGVFQCPPTAERNSWIHVSSGMSNPWEAEEAEEYSGFGTEFVLETTDASNWAIDAVQTLMAYNILLAHGRFGERPLIDYDDRIPFVLPSPQEAEPRITAILVTEPEHYPRSFDLISGKVDLLHLIGITANEWNYAKECGSGPLVDRLRRERVYPLTLPGRESLI